MHSFEVIEYRPIDYLWLNYHWQLTQKKQTVSINYDEAVQTNRKEHFPYYAVKAV